MPKQSSSRAPRFTPQKSTSLRRERVTLAVAVLACLAAPVSPRSTYAQTTQPPPIGGAGTLSGVATGGLHPRTPATATSVGSVPDDFSAVSLAPGYLLDMQVYDMPEISGQLRVDNNGDITVPMAGSLHVDGMSLAGAHDAIEAKLRDAQILKNPKISLDVAQYSASNVTVLGEVSSPGRVQMLAPHALGDVLAMVGGETVTAGPNVEIRHTVNGHMETQVVAYSRSKNTPGAGDIVVRPGDTVTVPRAGIVYVLGAVSRPGGYVMQEDGQLNAVQAISLAYGTVLNAAMGDIRIVHKNPDGTLTTTPVPFHKIMQGKAVAPALQSEDIVYVPVSKGKTILSAGAVASTSSALIYTVR